MKPKSYLTIHYDHLLHNFGIVKTLAPTSKILAMVKANAYGHGLIEAAKTLENKVDALGVARIEEAAELRKANINCRIVVMSGPVNKDDLEILDQLNCDIVIHQQEQIHWLNDYSNPNTFHVWLKINTGMNRLGFDTNNFSSAHKRLCACTSVKNPITALTHFSDADRTDFPKTLHQHKQFLECTQNHPVEKSCANSAAILAFPETHHDWVRPGLMLYGISPFKNTAGKDHQLKPVMSLHAQIIAINFVKTGEAVGYGSTHTVEHDTHIAVLGIGYGDGLLRNINSTAHVTHNNKTYPIVGRISMDMTTIDLGLNHKAKLGDYVTLWGIDGIPVETWATAANTIPYELTCHVAARYIEQSSLL